MELCGCHLPAHDTLALIEATCCPVIFYPALWCLAVPYQLKQLLRQSARSGDVDEDTLEDLFSALAERFPSVIGERNSLRRFLDALSSLLCCCCYSQ